MLDYQNVAGEVVPLVAAAYALKFMGQGAMADYRTFEGNRDRGDFSTLPELHASLSGLKVRNEQACMMSSSDVYPKVSTIS